MTIHTTGKRAALAADIFGTVLTLTFADGRAIEIDAAKLAPDIQHAALMHGLKQKLIDAAAIARSLDNGHSASLDDKYAAVAEVHARLTSGTPSWNKPKEAAKTPATSQNLFIRALMHMTGKDRAYIDQFLEAKTKDERAELRKNPRVLAAIAELQAQNAQANAKSDELLGELGIDAPEAIAEPAKPAKAKGRKTAPVAEPA